MSYIKSRKHAAPAYVTRQTTGTSIAAATLLALTMPVGAQTATTLGTVTIKSDSTSDYKADSVASPKATAALIDTPQTISIIKETLVREQRASTLTEALRNSPGVGTFNLGENGTTSTGDAIYMRGSDASNSIFVDGVRDIGTISRDVFNIDQIEVLKGGAGSDIGRGSATGSINLVSKQPTLENFITGSVGAGSGQYKRGSIDWNRKIDDDKAFRLNLVDENSGVEGRDFIKNKRFGIAPSFAFGLSSATRVNIDYLHVKQNNIPDGGVSTVGLPGYTSPDPTRPFLTNAARVNSNNFYGTTADHDDVTADMFTVIVDHDLGNGAKIRNTTRWGKTDQEYFLNSFNGSAANFVTPVPSNPATWTIVRTPTSKNITNKILTNQTNFATKLQTGSFEHNLATGVELIREEQVQRLYGATGAFPPVNLYNPNPNVTGYNRALNGDHNDGKTDTLALYALDTMKINDSWLLNGGLRYDRYKTNYTTRVGNVVTPLEAKDGVWSGKLGPIFKLDKNTSFYASYALTTLPPGGVNFQLVSTNNPNNPNVDPQKASTIEAGVKHDLYNGKLSLTGAVYKTKYSDQIVADGSGGFYRAGDKSVQGIELGAVGNITSAWAVTAGLTTMSTSSSGPIATTNDGSAVLPYNPKSAFTSWTTYRLSNGFTIGGGARYSGKMKRGLDGASGTPAFTEAYWVLDAMVGYQVNKNFDLQLNIYNLADEDYVAAINKSGYRYTPGIPRSARLTANFTF